MKTKKAVSHTPGPWKWKGEPFTGIASFYDDGSERGIVAHVGSDGGEYGRPEAIANARLISAAPMMYSLLRAWRNSDPQSEYVNKIDEVIAQIEGLK